MVLPRPRLLPLGAGVGGSDGALAGQLFEDIGRKLDDDFGRCLPPRRRGLWWLYRGRGDRGRRPIRPRLGTRREGEFGGPASLLLRPTTGLLGLLGLLGFATFFFSPTGKLGPCFFLPATALLEKRLREQGGRLGLVLVGGVIGGKTPLTLSVLMHPDEDRADDGTPEDERVMNEEHAPQGEPTRVEGEEDNQQAKT